MDRFRNRRQLPLSRSRLAPRRPLVKPSAEKASPRRTRRRSTQPSDRCDARHETIRRVTADIEQRQQLNTGVSALMKLVNELYAFSEQTVTGVPSHRGDEDVEHAGDVERAETIAVIAKRSKHWC